VKSGAVTIDGVNVRDITLKSLRQHIGIVMQETFLFSMTVRDNIAYGSSDASLERIVAAAKAARAHDFILRMQDGYDTVIGERGVTLSGGQKQRLAIARALLVDPRILILDNATASVDSETEHEIQEALRVLMTGRTSFVIAQRLSTIQDADQVLVFEDGRISQRGTPAELLGVPGFYRELYDLQLKDQEEASARRSLEGDGGPQMATAELERIDAEEPSFDEGRVEADALEASESEGLVGANEAFELAERDARQEELAVSRGRGRSRGNRPDGNTSGRNGAGTGAK
jgi:ABC-type multidrug transport system ATPase subunit